MAKSDVLALVADLSDGLADATAASIYYDDVVYDLGANPDSTLVNAESQITGSIQAYAAPAPAIVNIAAFFSGKQLAHSTTAEAQLFTPEWRGSTTRGIPHVWLEDTFNDDVLGLVPIPAFDSGAVTADPTTALIEEGALTILYTEFRADVHLDEELPVALETLAREFSRDSDHTDRTFAQSCRALSSIFFQLLGIALEPPRVFPEEPTARSGDAG